MNANELIAFVIFFRLAAEEVEHITDNARDVLLRITAEPETTLEIVSHIALLEGIEEEMQQLFADVDYAHDVFIIIKDFSIPIDNERKEEYMDCEDMVNRTFDKLKKIQAKRPQFIKKLEEKMNDDIKLIFEETHEIYVQILDPKLLDVSFDFFLLKKLGVALRKYCANQLKKKR